jgi:large subunit ribosomal protein L18
MTTTSEKRNRNHKRIRTLVSGTSERPRLSVFKSNIALYAQLIDDENGTTLASATGSDAEKVGSEIAKLGLAKKIEKVVFDRGGFIYTGKVQKLAEAARAGGLSF